MINVFTFASNDASLTYLAQIFGYMNGVIPIPSTNGPQASGTTVSLLGTMFMTFNSIILVIGTLLVVYTTVVGLLMTAHEGEFMKKWNSLWTPVRTVIGIAALVPTGSGYSGIQMIMMWVIVQGIGAADSLWSTALNYVNVMGSVQSQLSLPGVSAYQTMTQLFQSLVCDATAHISKTDPVGETSYYCGVASNASTGSFCSGTISQFNSSSGATTFSLGPSGSCGVLTYCDQSAQCSSSTNSIGCQACQAQVQALQTVVTALSAIAVTVAQNDFAYRDWHANSGSVASNSNWQMMYDYCKAQQIPQNQCCIPSILALLSPGSQSSSPCKGSISNNFPALDGRTTTDSSDDVVNQIIWPYSIQSTYGTGSFISAATSEYMNVLSQAVNNYIVGLATSNTSQLTGQLAQAQQTGWLLAGSYYYTVASVNNQNLTNAIPTFSMTTQAPTGGVTSVMSYYRNNVIASSTLISAASGAGGGGNSNLNTMAGPMYSAGGSVSDSFNNMINSNSNPLATLAATGYTLLMIAQVLFIVFIAITIVLGFVGNIDIEVVGNGALDPLGPAMMLVYLVIMPALMMVFGILITYGGLLGVYVPLIPYIVFTVGSVGWFISTIEAMVAGPLVALGIIAPGGQHEILGHAHHGILMLLNIFLRPSLMIFGLMASMLLAGAMVAMVNSAFSTVMAQIASMSTGANTSAGTAALVFNPLESIFFLAAYISLVVTVLNKCFAAIYLLPQQVITWLGGHGASAGEAEALADTKHATEAAGAGMKGAGEKTVSAGQQANKTRGEKAQRDANMKKTPPVKLEEDKEP